MGVKVGMLYAPVFLLLLSRSIDSVIKVVMYLECVGYVHKNS